MENLVSLGTITGLPFFFMLSNVRVRTLKWLFTVIAVTMGAWIVLGASPVLAAPDSGTNNGGFDIQPVTPNEVAKGMDTLASDVSNLAAGLSLPLTLILLFLAVVMFLFAVVIKKARGIAVGFLIMAIVFFFVFGNLKGTVNFVVGTLEWIKGHF